MRTIKFPVVNVHDNNSNNGKGKRHRKRYYERRPTKKGGGKGEKWKGKGTSLWICYNNYKFVRSAQYDKYDDGGDDDCDGGGGVASQMSHLKFG